MVDPPMSVTPYWELTFDADGDVDRRQRDRLSAEAVRRRVEDVIVFCHGWNNDRSLATRLYDRFFALVPPLAPAARIGYVGVIWPSMRFPDEPVPDFPRSSAEKDTARALIAAFPDRAAVVEQLLRTLEQRPPDVDLSGFGRLVRLLVDAVPPDPRAPYAADTVPGEEPGMFSDPVAACSWFARASAEGFSVPNPWDGAKELLRQAAYHAMKRRAGTVGERGLGPVIGRLARAAPGCGCTSSGTASAPGWCRSRYADRPRTSGR